MRLAEALAVATIVLGAATGCSKGQFVDMAMRGAARPATMRDRRVGDYLVLGGDMHCHVSPPDSPGHVSRDLSATLALATDEGLDFVVLTPHVRARFFLDDEERSAVLAMQGALRSSVARARSSLVVIPGFEYTDHRYGHLGASFADLGSVLADAPTSELRERPETFFEHWIERGGVLTINHPTMRPIPNAPFRELRYDMSFRGLDPSIEVPSEIAFVAAHAQTIETFNASASFLRDRFIVGDEDRSLRETFHFVDTMNRKPGRRLTPAGGSDSHGDWLRPTTWVLARERSEAAIRDAIVTGRTCVRGPEACSFELRRPDGSWANVGGDIPEGSTRLDARASGGDVVVYVNGEVAARGASDEIVHVDIARSRCAIVRAIVGRSWSAPIRVGCRSGN